jgi:hypothetical protein
MGGKGKREEKSSKPGVLLGAFSCSTSRFALAVASFAPHPKGKLADNDPYRELFPTRCDPTALTLALATLGLG